MNEMWDENDEDLGIEETQPVHRARRSSDGGSRLYLLTGLVIGLALGLLYAWVISPVQYSDIAPSLLSSSAQAQYLKMIALAYSSDQDLPRARERLTLIDSANPQQTLAMQAQRMVAEKQSAQEARALAVLAAALGQPTPTSAPSITPTADETTTPFSAAQASTPSIANVLPPSPTPTTAAMDAVFTLKSKQAVCDGSIPVGILQVQVNDKLGNPLPGVKIMVTWDGGEDVFYTGLMPDANLGYADFSMNPGITYQVNVGDTSDLAKEVTIPNCSGGWKVVFQKSS